MFSLPEKEGATVSDISLEASDDGAESDADDPSEAIVDVGEENVILPGARLLENPMYVGLFFFRFFFGG